VIGFGGGSGGIDSLSFPASPRGRPVIGSISWLRFFSSLSRRIFDRPTSASEGLIFPSESRS